jgi:hypothetical protein
MLSKLLPCRGNSPHQPSWSLGASPNGDTSGKVPLALKSAADLRLSPAFCALNQCHSVRLHCFQRHLAYQGDGNDGDGDCKVVVPR